MTMSLKTMATAIIALSFAIAPAANAAERFYTSLSGANENPSNGSAGTGKAFIEISNALDFIKIDASFSGLSTNDVAAHIHCCVAPTANGPVVIDSPNLPGFPTGVQSGTYSATLSLLDAATYNTPFVNANGGTAAGARDAFLLNLRAGRAYFNIHTSQFPGGEIRGQFAAVPEPGAWSLMILGFGMAGGALRSHRRRVAYS
jgi:CHRD domain/PEP-CTERM motif